MRFISKNIVRLAFVAALIGLFAIGATLVSAQENIAGAADGEVASVSIDIEAENLDELAEQLSRAFEEGFEESFGDMSEEEMELAMGAMTGAARAGITVMIIMIVVGIGLFVFWLVLLIHMLSKPVPMKVVWVLLMIFLGFIGSLIYLIVYHVDYKKQIAAKGTAKEAGDNGAGVVEETPTE